MHGLKFSTIFIPLVIPTIISLVFAYHPRSFPVPLSSTSSRSSGASRGALFPFIPEAPVSSEPPITPSSSKIGNPYDFVIVGGGTAGCALARRLAENLRYSVLILEYGDYPNPGLDIPALFGKYLNDENRKVYRSVPQSDGSLSNNGTFNYLVGRQLGGTSGLNGMFFNRGSPHNYDEWARLTGDSSWNYSNLLPYFRKIEDYQGDFPSSQHGTQGPITVSRPKYAPGLEQWLEAGRFLGYPVADPNGPQQVSFTPVEFSKSFGRRVSSFSGYLRPFLVQRIAHRLRVIVRADVKRVIFAGNTAVGVIYSERDNPLGQNLFVGANREVIISAGVINSPIILMRSGIGPRRNLETARIPVLKSLPVGRNLQDHMVFRLNIILGNRSATFIPERDLTPKNFRLYNETGDGPYSSYQGTPGQAFIPSSRAPRRDWADTQISFLQSPGAASVLPGGSQNSDVQVAPWEILVSCAVYLVGPKSQGYLILNNTSLDQESDPIINFRYLSHPDDIQILKEAVKTALTIFEDTPTYRRMGTRYPPHPFPACAHHPFRSDPYWECLIRHQAGSGSHGVGTCRMGRKSGDAGSVVDTELKVLGFQHLRIADASVIPRNTNANTQAAVYVIAEKAADMILRN